MLARDVGYKYVAFNVKYAMIGTYHKGNYYAELWCGSFTLYNNTGRPRLSSTPPAITHVCSALHNDFMRYVNFLFDTYYNITLYTPAQRLYYIIVTLCCSAEVAREYYPFIY